MANPLQLSYYPFGMNITALSSAAPMGMPNRFKYNAGTELNSDFGIDWYETPFRGFDATLGRFMQIDPMADVLSSITPYNYGYNNPIMFNDPTGLIGENSKNDKKKDCPEGDCDPVYDGGSAGTFVVEGERESTTSTPSYVGGYWNYYLNKWKGGNPIERGLYANYMDNGLAGVQNVLGHSRTLSFSADGYRDAIAQGKRTQEALSKLVAYGVGGTIIATAALPIVGEALLSSGYSLNLAELLTVKFSENAVFNVGLELTSQIGTGLLNGQSWNENIDLFDLGLSAFKTNWFTDAALSSGLNISSSLDISLTNSFNSFSTDFLITSGENGFINLNGGARSSKFIQFGTVIIGAMSSTQYGNQRDE